jgi:hypothetical protein
MEGSRDEGEVRKEGKTTEGLQKQQRRSRSERRRDMDPRETQLRLLRRRILLRLAFKTPAFWMYVQ